MENVYECTCDNDNDRKRNCVLSNYLKYMNSRRFPVSSINKIEEYLKCKSEISFGIRKGVCQLLYRDYENMLVQKINLLCTKEFVIFIKIHGYKLVDDEYLITNAESYLNTVNQTKIVYR